MDAPPVQYVTTSDGFSIAYTVHGEGPTLVCLPFAFSHAQAVWSDSSASPLLRALAGRFRVVYYDSRGQGLSQRGLPPDTSIDSLLLDLHTVLDELGIERPILFAHNVMSHVAAHFAARNPDRVAALILMHCPVSFADHIAWISNMARQNWDFFMGMQVGLTSADGSQPVGRMKRRIEGLKARVTQEDFLSFWGAFARSDLGDLLAKVAAPALVLHPADQKYITQEESARVAALLRNGRLAVLGGPLFFGKPDEALAAIESLLAEAPAAGHATSAPIRRLSSREVEVLRLLAAGKSNQEIAETLVISLNTVLRHVSHIYDKTGAANRVQATAYARDHALL